MRCTRCKKKLKKGAKFCPACGTRVPKKKGKRIVAFLLAVLLLLSLSTIGLAIYVFVSENFSLKQGLSKIFTAQSTVKIANVEEAIAHAKELGKELGYENAMSEMTEKVITEIDGDCYYRLQQNYQGIPVYGRTLVYSTDEKGMVYFVTGNTLDVDGDFDIRPTLTYAQAVALANSHLQNKWCLGNIINDASAEKGERSLYVYNIAEKTQLVYSAFVGAYEILIDANSAEIVNIRQTLNVSSTSSSESAGANNYTWKNTDGTYVMRDFERNIYIYDAAGNTYWDIYKGTTDPSVLTLVTSKDQIFGNKDDSTTTASTAISYVKALSHAYDYFKASFSETGCGAVVGIYDDLQGAYNGGNAGGGLMYVDESISTSPPDYNHFDHNGQIGVVILGTKYSDNLKNIESVIDTIGHEYTHYISDKYVAWTHSSEINWKKMTLRENNCENGAIREALSDIFGELIEFEVCKKTDWIHGDRIIYNPVENGYPQSASHEVVRNKKGWVVLGEANTDFSHGFSTVISHAAYLMWNGGENYNASKKLTENQLANLWYRAMLMMPADCCFTDCRTLVELAASSMNLTQEQKQCVSEAFDAVGIPRASEKDYSRLVHFTATGKTAVKGTVYEVKVQNGYEMVTPIPNATISVYSQKSKKIDRICKNGFFEMELPAGTYSIVVEADGYIGQTITFELDENRTRYLEFALNPSQTDAVDPLVVKITKEPEAFAVYQTAASKTTESGTWAERLDLTANMSLTSGSARTKTKMVMTSNADISNYSEGDSSRVRISGAAELSVLGQTYAWNMRYENGTAHYQYTQPNQTSADLKIDPSFFNFETMTSDMMTKAKMSGNQITFTVPGDKITEVGIAAVNQMSDVDDLKYGDVDVIVAISSEGTIDTITMAFHASLNYQGYDADVDCNIVYRFSQSAVVSNMPSVTIVPCSYTGQESKFDILTVHEVNGNQIVFTAWWYRIWDISHATATLDGNIASFDYTDANNPNIRAKGTIEFTGSKAILTISECSVSEVHKGSYCFNFLAEALTEQQLMEVGHFLGVPDGLDVTYKQSTPYYWEGVGIYCTSVGIYYNKELVAAADVNSLNGGVAGGILMYSGSSSVKNIDIASTFGYIKAWETHDYIGMDHFVTTLAFQDNGIFCCGIGYYLSDWAATFKGRYEVNGDELTLRYILNSKEMLNSYQINWNDQTMKLTSDDGLNTAHQTGTVHLFEESPNCTAEELSYQVDLFQRYLENGWDD